MNLEWLKATEFYVFMALAAWLVYGQFIKPRREGDRADATADAAREEQRPGD